jgi:hypothetical protein
MKSHASHDLHLLTSPALWLCAIAAAFTMATAHAANTPDDLAVPSNAQSMTPKQAFEHDKAYCQGREKTEDRATCMKEANRAYQEARSGAAEGHATHAASHSHHHPMAKNKAADATGSSGTADSSSTDSTKQ